MSHGQNSSTQNFLEIIYNPDCKIGVLTLAHRRTLVEPERIGSTCRIPCPSFRWPYYPSRSAGATEDGIHCMYGLEYGYGEGPCVGFDCIVLSGPIQYVCSQPGSACPAVRATACCTHGQQNDQACRKRWERVGDIFRASCAMNLMWSTIPWHEVHKKQFPGFLQESATPWLGFCNLPHSKVDFF